MVGLPIALAVAVVVLLAVIAAQAAALARRSALVPGEPVIVCTRRPDDQSIHGVVVRDDPRGITLAAAHYLDADGSRRPIGDVWIERPVAFVQRSVAPVDVRSRDGEDYATPAPPLPDNRHLRTVRDAPEPPARAG